MEKKINKGLVFCVMVFLILFAHGCKSKAFKTLAGLYAIEKIESVPSGREISLGGISFNSLDLGKNNDCSIPTFGWNSCENCKWGVKNDSTITLDCSKSELAGVYGYRFYKSGKKYMLVLENENWVISCSKLMSYPQWSKYTR